MATFEEALAALRGGKRVRSFGGGPWLSGNPDEGPVVPTSGDPDSLEWRVWRQVGESLAFAMRGPYVIEGDYKVPFAQALAHMMAGGRARCMHGWTWIVEHGFIADEGGAVPAARCLAGPWILDHEDRHA